VPILRRRYLPIQRRAMICDKNKELTLKLSNKCLAKITIKNTDINYSWENREINFVSQQKR
jgi:hypothetical protein